MNSFIPIGFFTLVIMSCNTSQKVTAPVTSTAFDMQGHRGSRGLMPENTIAAMEKAIDLGVTTLEMDVVISKDEGVVVSHDPYFHENITTTPAGKHLSKGEGVKHLIFQMNYDSVMKYDVGMKPHPDFPRQEKVQAFKPLLVELLHATESYAKTKNRTIAYNIEIKSKPEYDGKRHPPIERFVDLAVEAIKAEGVEERTTIQSFDPRALKVVHSKYPSMLTSLLVEGNDKRPLNEQLKELGFTPGVYSPHYSLVTPALLEQCHAKGMKVIPWTVNTIDDIKRLKAMGVDGIITDYPDLFAQL